MKVSPRRPPKANLAHQKAYGLVILAATWLAVGIGLYCMIFQPPSPDSYTRYERETGWPIPSYYAYLVVVFPTVVWIWALLAWLGMKFFRNG